MANRWVTFDCYGTLVDWLSGMRTALDGVGVSEEDREELLAAYQVQEMVVKARGWKTYREILEVGLNQASKITGIHLGPDDAATVAEAWGDWPVIPDVPDALQALRDDDWKPVILTDGDDDFWERTKLKLTFEFDKVITSNGAGGFKPDLAPYHRFRGEIDDSDIWVHAANSWIHDMLPTARLGIPNVWLDRDRTGHPDGLADRHIYDATSLPAALADLMENGPKAKR